MTTISIVTPSLNQGRYLPEALDSVRTQSHFPVEHLVCDGGSTDNTLEVLQRLRDKREWSHVRWESRPDNGQSSALNRGFALASGEIIGWLNADDRYRSGCFEHVVNAFRRYPEVDVFYGDYALIDATGRLKKVRHEIEFSQFILTYHRVLYIPTAASFFRRRIFDDGFRLREHLHYAMDYEFFVRLARAGYRIQRTPSVLADFRVHSESKSCRARERQLAERRQILYSFSSELGRWPPGATGRAAVRGLEWTAAVMRSSRKLVQGAYFGNLEHEHATSSKEHSCGF